MKVLVAGWFSFEEMGATAGDLLVRDVVCKWLAQAGCSFDVALAAPFAGGVNWREANPAQYSCLIFACGPFGNGYPVTELLEHFNGCRLVGMNLSMLDSLDVWNPFDILFERDSSRTAHPDLAFVSSSKKVPVVGVVLVHPQKEYKKGAMHQSANETIENFIAAREISRVNIDTRLDAGDNPLRTPAEIESLIARMDIVLTTRLHGLVLSLKNGVPVIAVDPIAGGAKIRRQAETIGWETVFTADKVTDELLHDAFDCCLTKEAKIKAEQCAERARQIIEKVRNEFVQLIPTVNGLSK
jgi:hypothetical protein